MIKVRIHKSWNNYVSKKFLEKFRGVVNWGIDYHGLRHKNHIVNFYLVDSLDHKRLTDGRVVGRYIRYNTHSDIYIVVKKRTTIGIYVTVFHELTHLKHNLCNDICYTQWGTTWRGNPYPVAKTIDTQTYLNLPDEIDARYHEKLMTKKWLVEKMKSLILFWRN